MCQIRAKPAQKVYIYRLTKPLTNTSCIVGFVTSFLVSILMALKMPAVLMGGWTQPGSQDVVFFFVFFVSPISLYYLYLVFRIRERLFSDRHY